MGGEVLARKGLRVGGTEAALKAAPTVQAGGDLEVAWTGPDNRGDIVSLVAPGARGRSEIYAYTGNNSGGVLVLVAPEKLGDYELVYFTGARDLVRTPVKVVQVSATLDAPEEVVATLAFEISWTGPGNRGDRIVLTAPEATIPSHGAHQSYVVRDEPVVKMTAPDDPGDYVLSYASPGGRVLATRRIKVTPAPSNPGFLKVATAERPVFGPNSAVELILDASGSMLKRQGGKPRIEIAKDTLHDVLDDVIPAGTGFALRVFGHKEADSCRTDLEIPLGPLDPATAKRKVASINAKNLARTPIAASIEKVGSDLAAVTGERIVVLVTDGEETCDGDPALAIRMLRSHGTDVRVNIIGYSIDDEALKASFASWAAIGGGEYLNAPDAAELAKALRQALQIPFDVYSGDKLVAEAVTGGPRLKLPAGDYRIRYRWDGKEMEKAATVESEMEAAAILP